MKQLRLCLSVISAISLLGLTPIKAFGLDISNSPSLIITEIKIKNDASVNGYNEFIELYNADITSLNLNDFTIEYYNSPSPADSDQPVKKVVVADGLLLPTQSIILAANKQQITNALDSPFTNLSDSGGLVRIRNLDKVVQDQVAWTSISALAISPVLFLSSSTSNKNKSFVRSLDSSGNPTLINPSWQLTTPNPHSETLLALSQPNPDPEAENTPEITPSANENVTPEENSNLTTTVLPIQLSELLPNPAAPGNDSTDEYIELFNPNDEAVDLSGYRLQSGNTYAYSYTFTNGTLAPHEYQAFYVNQTNDLLANSGGQARLLDPLGQVISQTSQYDTANDGSAWALISGTWQWTITPTPNAANTLTLAEVKSDKTTSSKTTASKAKTSTAKVASAKTAKPKTTTPSSNSGNNTTATPASVHPMVIAGVGVLAVAYALYEYRFDFSNRLYQLRRYRTNRRENRLTAKG